VVELVICSSETPAPSSNLIILAARGETGQSKELRALEYRQGLVLETVSTSRYWSRFWCLRIRRSWLLKKSKCAFTPRQKNDKCESSTGQICGNHNWPSRHQFWVLHG